MFTSGLFSKIKIFPTKLDGKFPLFGNTLILFEFFILLLLAGPALADVYLSESPGLTLSRASFFHCMAVHLIEMWRLLDHNLSSNLPLTTDSLSIPCFSDISMKHSLSS